MVKYFVLSPKGQEQINDVLTLTTSTQHPLLTSSMRGEKDLKVRSKIVFIPGWHDCVHEKSKRIYKVPE